MEGAREAVCENPVVVLAARSAAVRALTVGEALCRLDANDKAEDQMAKKNAEEPLIIFTIQTFASFLLAGGGMVAAGVLLERSSRWTFFAGLPEAIVLALALLGLKGNLEMTLASRLSTMANLGRLATRAEIFRAFGSNVALVQAQAIVVSLIAAMIANVSHLAEGAPVDITRATCLTVTAVATASTASLMLTSLMIAITVAARRFHVNPDNVATPMAAATGDVITLLFLILFGAWFYRTRVELFAVQATILVSLVLSTPVWMWLAAGQPSTRSVLKYGWFAVLTAMMISSAGGYILKISAAAYPQINLFQPVVNGAGGNLVAVQASKISTYLHGFGKLKILPMNRLKTYLNPLFTFTGRETESSHACLLVLMAIPGHLIFLLGFMLVEQEDQWHLNWPLVGLYFAAATSQLLSRLIWRAGWDPDSHSIPLLTAAGDLLGTLLLGAAFHLNAFLSWRNDAVNQQ